MDEKEVHNEYDMLRGNMNRMFLTDDVAERKGQIPRLG